MKAIVFSLMLVLLLGFAIFRIQEANQGMATQFPICRTHDDCDESFCDGKTAVVKFCNFEDGTCNETRNECVFDCKVDAGEAECIYCHENKDCPTTICSRDEKCKTLCYKGYCVRRVFGCVECVCGCKGGECVMPLFEAPKELTRCPEQILV